MNEESTWFDLLPGLHNITRALEPAFKRQAGTEMFPTAFSLTHVFSLGLVALITCLGAVAFSRAIEKEGTGAIIPPNRFNVRNFFEMFTDAVLNVAEGVMGEHNARRFLPLIGTLAFFIFFSNALALLPGFAPPTATLKTNLAIALTVFLVTHVAGVKEHGLKYFKHFLGPVWWLAPLMLPIELISHLARPVSLSLRLLGNIAADHKVVAAFFVMVPLLLPIPFLILGVLVCIVQTLVFCLLSMVYIQGAVAHEDH